MVDGGSGFGGRIFFSGLLQNRLGVLLKSEWSALAVSAFIFGLVHAPGVYLRQAGVVEGIGESPGFFTSISYCIAIQTIPGLFLGILWIKTRNLWLLMAIHAMIDLLPNLAEFIRDWNI